jgi:ATP-binding cassette subfamily B protein RaxB
MLAIPGMRRRIKPVLQNEANECGLACLTMIANFHKHDISLSYLRSLFPLSQRGMTLAEIVELAGQLDLDAQGLGISAISELANLRCPALLHWNGNHFVVLESVKNGKFTVQDPAFGTRIYSAIDMEIYFSGIALEFEPRVQFAAIRQAKKSTFWQVFRACRGIEHTIGTVAVLSFAASLFALATPVFLQVALDTVIPQFDLDLLTIVAIGMALFSAFEASARWLRDWVTLRAATLFEIYFTRNVVGHALRLPVTYFELRHPGDFITRLSSIDQIKTFIINGFVTSVADGAMSVLLIVMMFYYSTTMAAVSLGTLIVALVLRLSTYPKIEQQTLATLEARSEEQTRLIDGLKSVAALKVHNTSEFFGMKWFDSFSRFANRGFVAKKLAIDTDFLLHILFMLGTVATLYIGVTDVMKSVASVGTLYAFFALRSSFFNNMNALILNLLQLSIMRVHFERLDDVLDAEPEPAGNRVAIDREIRREVALKDIRVQFDAGSRPILDHVNIAVDIANAESIAIVGASGSGKSSLLKVLASLHQPASGRLTIDGQSIEAFGLQEYRARIGAVFAEDTLFQGTVYDNITMFSPDVTRQNVEEALRTVDLLDEIYQLPQSLATQVSAESPILSTGQKRRLLLARALSRRPQLLLLDEITANLDPVTEDRIIGALLSVPAAKVFVTHSERLLTRVDRAWRVIDGRLEETQPMRPKLIA